MRYKYIIPALCLFGIMSLHAEESGLGEILENVGQKKALDKPEPQKKKSKKQSRFVFKDEYHSNDIASKDKSVNKEKSESYDYENKSRFKFKFNDGSERNNLMGGLGSTGMGGSTGSSQGSGAGGQR